MRGAAEFSTPEAEHLAELEAELTELTEQLVAEETDIATAKAEFGRFGSDYLRRFAPLYELLDRLEAEIAALAATQDRTGAATSRAEAAAARAAGSAKAARAAEDAANGELGEALRRVDPSLRELYRKAAKLIHPDTAGTDDERDRRTRVMAAVNDAYQSGDAAAIRRILGSEAARPELVEGNDLGSQLVRTLRKVAQVRGRLADLAAMRRALEGDSMWQLFTLCHEGWAAGEDPLAEDEAQLRARIDTGQKRRDVLAKTLEARKDRS